MGEASPKLHSAASEALARVPTAQVPEGYAHPAAPIRLAGSVTHGYGRGSRQLGVPTANLPPAPLREQLSALPDGVYFGWGSTSGLTPRCLVAACFLASQCTAESECGPLSGSLLCPLCPVCPYLLHPHALSRSWAQLDVDESWPEADRQVGRTRAGIRAAATSSRHFVPETSSLRCAERRRATNANAAPASRPVQVHKMVMNIGRRPTFGDEEPELRSAGCPPARCCACCACGLQARAGRWLHAVWQQGGGSMLAGPGRRTYGALLAACLPGGHTWAVASSCQPATRLPRAMAAAMALLRSVEAHIMHRYSQDFYGQPLRLLALGFIRWAVACPRSVPGLPGAYPQQPGIILRPARQGAVGAAYAGLPAPFPAVLQAGGQV